MSSSFSQTGVGPVDADTIHPYAKDRLWATARVRPYILGRREERRGGTPRGNVFVRGSPDKER